MTDALLLVAHGSRDPRSSPVAVEVAAQVERRAPGLQAAACFLELSEPTPETAVRQLVRSGATRLTVAPFLLSSAYHANVDVPGVLETVRAHVPDVRLADVLGPDPLLIDALAIRLAETGVPHDAVVLAAAGSSNPDANAGVEGVAADLGARLGVPTTTAYASIATPAIDEAVAEARRTGHVRVAVATYLLAPGYFADRIAETGRAAGAVAVSAALGTAEPIVRLVAQRHAEAWAQRRTQPVL